MSGLVSEALNEVLKHVPVCQEVTLALNWTEFSDHSGGISFLGSMAVSCWLVQSLTLFLFVSCLRFAPSACLEQRQPLHLESQQSQNVQTGSLTSGT